MKPSEREYTGVTQFFHNYEHDAEGLTHCRGPVSNPYRIVHKNGKHLINVEYAKGHGKLCKEQWFHFTKKVGLGWDLASGVKVESSKVPRLGKTKLGFKINDKPVLSSKTDHAVVRKMLTKLEPLSVKNTLRKLVGEE
jgi:hypothetical protein